MPKIEDTLKARGSRYGSFLEQATVTNAIKEAMHTGRHWRALAPDEREALEMIALKTARILTGDPHYHDSWHDIVGYAKLVADRLLAGADDAPRQSADSLTASVLEAAGRKGANGSGRHALKG